MESVKEKIWLVVQELQSHPPPNPSTSLRAGLPLEGGGAKKAAAPSKGRS